MITQYRKLKNVQIQKNRILKFKVKLRHKFQFQRGRKMLYKPYCQYWAIKPNTDIVSRYKFPHKSVIPKRTILHFFTKNSKVSETHNHKYSNTMTQTPVNIV